jgi:hypothetical protein
VPFVITADQRSSRRTVDRVPHALGLLAQVPVVRPFERTAGDEFQGVLDDATAVVDAASALLRDGRWSIGIGCGPVERPLPAMTRAGRGPAFLAARQAIDAAKSRPQRIAVRAAGNDPASAAAADGEAVLTLLAAIVDRRSRPGWEAIDAVSAGRSITAAAERLGVTRQAVGQRLATAHRDAEVAGRTTAARLLLRCLDATEEDSRS